MSETRNNNALDTETIDGIEYLVVHYFDDGADATRQPAACGYISLAHRVPAIEAQALAARARRLIADGRFNHCRKCQREVDFS